MTVCLKEHWIQQHRVVTYVKAVTALDFATFVTLRHDAYSLLVTTTDCLSESLPSLDIFTAHLIKIHQLLATLGKKASKQEELTSIT